MACSAEQSQRRWVKKKRLRYSNLTDFLLAQQTRLHHLRDKRARLQQILSVLEENDFVHVAARTQIVKVKKEIGEVTESIVGMTGRVTRPVLTSLSPVFGQ